MPIAKNSYQFVMSKTQSGMQVTQKRILNYRDFSATCYWELHHHGGR